MENFSSLNPLTYKAENMILKSFLFLKKKRKHYNKSQSELQTANTLWQLHTLATCKHPDFVKFVEPSKQNEVCN